MSTFNLNRFRAGMYPTVFDVYQNTMYEDKPLGIEITGRDIAEARSKFKKKYGTARYDLERILFIPNTEKTKAKQQELMLKRMRTPEAEQATEDAWRRAP